MHDCGSIPTAGIAAAALGPPADGDLLATFNGLREEIVSTLYYVLGNRDDAQDAAQDAFLKCWRAKDGLAEVTNLRAWVFRVALNAARDLRRSAWRRKSRPLPGEDAMDADPAGPPGDSMEHREELDLLRAALANFACSCKCRASPCIGTQTCGRIQPYISRNSSRRG